METMHAAGRRRLPPVPRPAGSRSAAGQLTVERPRTEPADLTVDEPVVAEQVVTGAAPDEFATQVIDTRQIAAELIEAELAALTEAVEADVVEDADADAEDAVDVVEDASDTAQDDTEQFQPSELAARIAAAEAAELEDVESETAEPESEAVELEAADVAEHPAELAIDEHDPAQQFVARLRSLAGDFAGAAGAESAVVREAVPPARHRRARCRLVLRYDDGDVADVTLLGPAGAPGRPSRHGFDRQVLRWLGAGLVRDRAWLVEDPLVRDRTWLVEDPDAPDGVAVDISAWVAAS